MSENEVYKLVRNQDALEYCKKQSMLEQMVANETWKHYEYAKKALKKQIPQKVINLGYFYGYAHHCPSCNAQVEKRAYGVNDKYCRECGQALDWS